MVTKYQEIKTIVEDISENIKSVKGSNLRILDFKTVIIDEVNTMFKHFQEQLKREENALISHAAEVPNLIKSVKMKINHDEFESKMRSKADKNYVETFKGTVGQLIKTEKFFLLTVSEILKMI